MTVRWGKPRPTIDMKRVKKENKYKNKIIVLDGIRFHSVKEANRFMELKYLLNVGEISELQRQVKFDLVVNGIKICRIIVDHAYLNKNKTQVIEEVKGFATDKWKLKWKLMKALYPTYIYEVC